MRWGVLGWGQIARIFVSALVQCPNQRLLSVGTRSASPTSVRKDFTDMLEKGELTKRVGGLSQTPEALDVLSDYHALLEHPDVDAVYIALPHTLHAEMIQGAARMGKHILCEKPFALNRGESMVVWDTLEGTEITFLEGWMYRFHPQLEKVLRWVAEGKVGRLRSLQARFGADHRGKSSSNRLLSERLGGGAVLDIGGYPLSMACWVASAAQGELWGIRGPESLVALSRFQQKEEEQDQVEARTSVDLHSYATLLFPDDWMASLEVACDLDLGQSVRIEGSEGSIELSLPFSAGTQVVPSHASMPAKRLSEAKLFLNGEQVDVELRNPYLAEVEAFASAVFHGRREVKGLPWSHSETILRNLDRWRGAADIVYPWERAPIRKVCAKVVGLSKTEKDLRPSAERQEAIPKKPLYGLEKPVSSMVMGVDFKFHYPSACALFDAFWEAGGNAFDTARYYDALPMLGTEVVSTDRTLSDSCEGVLGAWVSSRGVRSEAVLISKGAHTPSCYPDSIGRELAMSLNQLQSDYLDIYLMHRDNVSVPVGEFVDAMNRLCDRGQVRCIGVSNWSRERIEEAQQYALKHQLRPLRVISNQLSLASWQGPLWPGCVSMRVRDDYQWLAGQQLPLLAWSSQAQGFFARSEDEIRRLSALSARWISPENLARKKRAQILAEEFECTAHAVALAFVLHQDFPSYALIGPRSMKELRASLEASAVNLSREEVQWLLWGSHEGPLSSE